MELVWCSGIQLIKVRILGLQLTVYRNTLIEAIEALGCKHPTRRTSRRGADFIPVSRFRTFYWG